MIIMWVLEVAAIVLTEIMLSAKNRTKENVSKKVLFWLVVACVVLFSCYGIHYMSLIEAISIIPILMIPVRLIFELVLIGLNIERNILSNNQKGTQNYRSNYTSNTQNNN